ncbi:MAG: DUF120 domain-containing protein [Pseudomonadota bacterium]|nr:DUF120 domain-containing protein [Pseudomonadota bacterium]
MELTGKVVTGARQAAAFTQLDWVREQCAEKLGFQPFPGTLNLKIVAEDFALLAELKGTKGPELQPTDPNFCVATVLPIQIESHQGAVVIPAQEVDIHRGNILEIISAVNLRRTLVLKDGDPVTVRYLIPPTA